MLLFFTILLLVFLYLFIAFSTKCYRSPALCQSTALESEGQATVPSSALKELRLWEERQPQTHTEKLRVTHRAFVLAQILLETVQSLQSSAALAQLTPMCWFLGELFPEGKVVGANCRVCCLWSLYPVLWNQGAAVRNPSSVGSDSNPSSASCGPCDLSQVT